jgi:uncharacterized membrane protein HdeD (DUF308 family)
MGQVSASSHKAFSAGVAGVAVLVTLFFMGLERAADGGFYGVVQHLKDNVSSIDPFYLGTSLHQRLACGYSGECGPCTDWRRRIGKIDCSGPKISPDNDSGDLFVLKDGWLQTPKDRRSWLQRNREYWAWAPGIVFGLMSLPVAVLFMLWGLLKGGWLVSLIGFVALVLGFSTSYKLLGKEKNANPFALVAVGFFCVAIYQLIFHWVVMGLLSAIASVLVFVTIIGGAVKAALSVVEWSFRIKELRSNKRPLAQQSAPEE